MKETSTLILLSLSVLLALFSVGLMFDAVSARVDNRRLIRENQRLEKSANALEALCVTPPGARE